MQHHKWCLIVDASCYCYWATVPLTNSVGPALKDVGTNIAGDTKHTPKAILTHVAIYTSS